METDASGQTKGKEANAKDAKAEEANKKLRPLLPKSSICRLLAELVRSYAGVAKLVYEHAYHSGQSELVVEVCSNFTLSIIQ